MSDYPNPEPHRHMWFTEQQSGHEWCHYCGVHSERSRGKCVEKPPLRVQIGAGGTQMPVNAIAGPQTAMPRGLR